MTKASKEESGIKVKGENRVKKIISARVLGGMAAMLLVVASVIGLNQQTDTAQAAKTEATTNNIAAIPPRTLAEMIFFTLFSPFTFIPDSSLDTMVILSLLFIPYVPVRNPDTIRLLFIYFLATN